MGKRRERRQQQQQLQPGRRVKLDLYSDPGDAVSPPPQPPSSTTHTASELISENPLSLLGQYSDDEGDDEDGSSEPSKSPDQKENPSNVLSNEILHQATVKVEQNGDEQKCEISLKDEAAQKEWQAVLHEDSGEYYYWNLQTGETTWKMPTSLEKVIVDVSEDLINQMTTLERESVLVVESLQKEGALDKHSNEHHHQSADTLSSPVKDIEIIASERSNLSESNLTIATEAIPDAQVAIQGPGVVTLEDNLTSVQNSDDSFRPSADVDIPNINECKAQNGSPPRVNAVAENDDRDAEPLQDIQAEHLTGEAECEINGDNGIHSHVSEPLSVIQMCEETAGSKLADRSDLLAEKGEALQQRLRNLAGDSLAQLSRHGLMAIQTEVHLGVWKAFSALDFAPEACFSLIFEELTKIETILALEEAVSIGTSNISHSTILDANRELKAAGKDSLLSSAQYAEGGSKYSKRGIKATANGIMGTDEDVEEGEIHDDEVRVLYPNLGERCSHSGTDGADMDMEVDMEVDNDVESEPAVPGTGLDIVSSTNVYSYPVHMDLSTTHSVDSQFYPDSSYWVPPLPPDDGWTPPPPGETELIPPPPLEEPPPLPPDSPQAKHPYILESSVPSVEYYPSDYMTPADYVPAQEYQSVAVDSSFYGTYVQEIPGSYTLNTQANETGGIEQPYIAASDPISTYVGWATALVPPRPSFTLPSIPRSTFRNSNSGGYQSMSGMPIIPESSTAGAESNAVASSAEAKKPPKGKAIKKRAHSVSGAPMLNKKVSNLVSKWKQAKEELHGSDEDDEDERALYDIEVLEKKKQKEIEEWRMQQIASGGAMDNANFQPLGTIDWRERVKRAKKADAKRGDMQESFMVSEKEAEKEDNRKAQKPDLTQISKDLPGGWQAFWDDESGEVYYGNLETQETSWDKPLA